MAFFIIKWIWLDVGYFNIPGSEIYHFYREIGLEVTFKKKTAEPKIPEAQLWLYAHFVQPHSRTRYVHIAHMHCAPWAHCAQGVTRPSFYWLLQVVRPVITNSYTRLLRLAFRIFQVAPYRRFVFRGVKNDKRQGGFLMTINTVPNCSPLFAVRNDLARLENRASSASALALLMRWFLENNNCM